MATVRCPECGCRFWEATIDLKWRECTNCCYKRPYRPRATNYSQLSAAQKRVIDKIKLAIQRNGKNGEITELEIKPIVDYRNAHVVVSTQWEGVICSVGRRGKLTVDYMTGLLSSGSKTECRLFEYRVKDLISGLE